MRQQSWQSCLSITNTRNIANQTQAYGQTQFALTNPGFYAGNFHRGRDVTVRRDRWGPILSQHYVAPVDCVIAEIVDSAWGYGYHLWLSTGQWRILFAHGIPHSVMAAVRQPIVAGTPLMPVGTSGASSIAHGHIGVQARDGRWADPGPFMYGQQAMEVETVADTTALEELQERFSDLDDLHREDLNAGARAVRLANKLRDRLAGHENRPPTDPWPDDLKAEGEHVNTHFAHRG